MLECKKYDFQIMKENQKFFFAGKRREVKPGQGKSKKRCGSEKESCCLMKVSAST